MLSSTEGEGEERKREREEERKRHTLVRRRERDDDDDGCKGGCPSSFSSATARRIPSGTARQLSTVCRSLPLLKTRSSSRRICNDDSGYRAFITSVVSELTVMSVMERRDDTRKRIGSMRLVRIAGQTWCSQRRMVVSKTDFVTRRVCSNIMNITYP